MTLLEIKTEAAAFHKKVVADLTINGIDLFLSSANQAKQQASQLHDFGFQRKMLTLTVNSITGGSLDDAVIQGTGTPVNLKRVVDMGTFDTQGNFIPAEWTTTEESQERQRQENAFGVAFRYPTDAQYRSRLCGESRLVLRGNQIFVYPLGTTSENVTVGIDAFIFDADWTAADLTTAGAILPVAVTGTLSPDVTGTYFGLGTDTGSGYVYTKLGPIPSILYNLNGTWYLVPLSDGTATWTHVAVNTNPVGTYAASGVATGIATVALSTVPVGGAVSVWTKKGSKFILWQTICDLNKYFKTFVPREEGNLTEPQALADAGLAAFIEQDIFLYEQSRRHGR